jgi:hypothetical protein
MRGIKDRNVATAGSGQREGYPADILGLGPEDGACT